VVEWSRAGELSSLPRKLYKADFKRTWGYPTMLETVANIREPESQCQPMRSLRSCTFRPCSRWAPWLLSSMALDAFGVSSKMQLWAASGSSSMQVLGRKTTRAEGYLSWRLTGPPGRLTMPLTREHTMCGAQQPTDSMAGR